jgi:hypothetical protein
MGWPPAGPRTGAHVTLPLTGSPAHHEEQRDRQVRGRLGQHVWGIGYGEPASFGSGSVDVIEPNAEVREESRPQWFSAENISREPVGYGTQQGIGSAQRLLESSRTERTIIPVEPNFEVLTQLFFHRSGKPPGDDDGRTGCHFTATGFRDDRLARAAATVDPSSAGLGATVRPAVRMISAFSAAVSPNAEMIAPA